jgi:GT2 family glycosyltransferase
VLVSAVVVSYRSGDLARTAVRSFRESARRAGLELEVIGVVNSGEDAEADILRPEVDRLLTPERNLGYAGGLNLGMDGAGGDVLLLANPDVVALGDAVPALAEAALARFGAAGPAFFHDDGGTILAPPFEEPGLAALVRRRLARRDPARANAVFRREARRVLRHAEAVDRGVPAPASSLTGALLAVSRATLRRVGPFDEGYALYYEENDWERRLRRLGGELVCVGAARVVHRFNQSGKQAPERAAWFAASERRYFGVHHGPRGLEAVRLLAESPEAPRVLGPLPNGALSLASSAAAVALSPIPWFVPFALARPRGAAVYAPPRDFLGSIAGEPWYARAFDPATGAVLAEGRLV